MCASSEHADGPLDLVARLGARESLVTAWRNVASKGGVAGIDRVTIAAFEQDLDENIETLQNELRTRTYRPLPVVRIRPAFLAASDRALVVPAVRDRVVQRAIAELLGPLIEPTLCPACRAFRKGSSAQATAADVGRWIEQGCGWVLRADIRAFFDSIQPDVLRRKLEPFVDARGLDLLSRLLRSKVYDRHQLSEMVVGIAQGSPLSPLLANLYLADLDHEMVARFPRYVRYCDDILVLHTAEDPVRKALDQLAGLLEPLGLELNQDKTRICRVEDGFVFLGYQLGATGRGPAVKAVEALHFRLDELSCDGSCDVQQLDAVYRGWTGYFGPQPECWLAHPAGLLGLLRAKDHGGVELDRVREARARIEGPVGPGLGLELARAWVACRSADQAWLELARTLSASQADTAQVDAWAEVLQVEPGRLRAVVRSLVGEPRARIEALAEQVAELGRYAEAQQLAALDPAALDTRSPEHPAAAGPEAADQDDLTLLGELFQGRDGVHSVESVNPGGHRHFTAVQRAIGPDDWKAHLAGERTLALAMVRADQTVLWGVLDVDVERRVLDLEPGNVDAYLGRALGAALRLRGELERRGCASLLELSGAKGYHVWVRLAEPVRARDVRRWLLDVIQAAQPFPEGVRVEEFPNRDTVRADATGPVIKLPLGVHSKTGRRCELLDASGQPLEDPFEALRSLPRVAREVIDGWLEQGRRARLEEVRPREVGGAAARLVEQCHVLAALKKRAEETFYLTHVERQVLLCTLGHLGSEGSEAIHAVISRCHNYRAEVTDRQIRKMPDAPISCPRIRERLPQITAAVGCSCHFNLRSGGYPTPVLHVRKPSQISAFTARRGRPPGAAADTPRPSGGQAPGEPLVEAAEQRIRKIAEMKRHIKGIESSITRLSQELATLFDEAGVDELLLPLGTLRRTRRDGPAEGWDFRIEV